MKQDNRNNELRERQTYVPASVKVITTSVQRVICTSGDDELSGGIGDMGRTPGVWD